jgi:hypothetical protein
MRGARLSILTLAATLAVALGALGLAVASPGNPRLAASLMASGALGLTSSRDGETLFNASLMRPGQPPVRGTLTVTNTGEAPEVLVLRASDIVDQAGPGGGRLSTQLVLTVADVTMAAAPVQLWSGRPGQLSEARLVQLARGESRALEVTATLPSAGNAYQGASVSLGLRWGVVRAAATLAPVVTPKPAPRPVTRPAAGGAPVDVAADELGLPAARRCVSRRRVTLRLRAPHRARIARVVVRVGKQKAKRIRGRGRRKVAVPVSLRRVRTRTVAVRIEVRTTDAHRYRSTRTYRICGA